MSKQQLYADLPEELQEADDILRRYGRWANRKSGPQRCGSAEGMYRAPQNDDDRAPKMPDMPPLELERARAALRLLPTCTLLVIQWLYVDTSALGAKMRAHRIQARHMRERHLDGVRLFWDAWQKQRQTGPVAIRSSVVENRAT